MKLIHRRLITCFLGISLTSRLVAPAEAAPFIPGNVVVFSRGASSTSVLFEFTHSGTLVRTATVSNDGFGNRDVSIGTDGKAYLFNGVFAPKLSVFDPVASAFEHINIDGWSTTNGYQGGVSSFGQYTFLSDMNTGAGSENGFIRVNNIDHTFIRVSTGDIGDVAIGLDGRVYTLSSVDDKRVRGYDPITLQLLTDVKLAFAVGAIAVNQDGAVFAARRDTATNGFIDKFASNGSWLQTLPAPGFGGLTDIDIRSDGSELMFTAAQGKIGYTMPTLASITDQFVVTTGTHDDTFAAYVPIPEPSTLALVIPVTASLLRRRRSRCSEVC